MGINELGVNRYSPPRPWPSYPESRMAMDRDLFERQKPGIITRVRKWIGL